MSKLLSVVVPTYNMQAYLDRCLSSFIMDEHLMSQLEVLVVNDGSKDSSSVIAHGYEEKYPETFIVIDKENGNYGSCVNRGLEQAAGKYFRILDADDWFDTKSLEQLLGQLEIAEADLLLTKFSVHYTDNVTVSAFPDGIVSGRMYGVADFDSGIFDAGALRMHGMTYRTQLLRESGLRLQHGISYTDTEYCYYPCKYLKSVMFFDLRLYCYDCTRDGQTMNPDVMARSVGNMYKVLKPMLQDYVNLPSDFTNMALVAPTVRNLLYMYYRVTLCLSRQTRELKMMLRDTDALLTPELEAFLSKGRMRRIDYMKVWRRYGMFSTSGIFRVYNWLFEKLKFLR